MNSSVCVIFTIILISLNLISGSRILAIFPIPYRDQQLIFRPLIDQLSKRGHQLTVVTTDPAIYDGRYDHPEDMINSNTNHYGNIEQIDLSFAHNLKVLKILNENSNDLSGNEMLRTVFHVLRTIAENELKSSHIQHLLSNATEQFDAVIVDWSGPSLMNGFAYKFNAPLIGITPGGAYISSHEAMGNTNHPVAFPSILMPFSENLNIIQRIASAFFAFRYRYLYFTEELPIQHEIAKNYFGLNVPDLWEIESNADLLLVNNYQVLGHSRPLSPTTIYLGGIHATKPKPLSWELQNFLDDCTPTGTIYINLGDSITKAFLNTERIKKLIKILESSSYDIIWNWNGSPVAINSTARFYEGGPIMQQEDVLAHKNVRLFITAGGQRDIEDAIHHSVPVFGVSFTSSLEHYLLQIVKHEAGIVANFDLEPESVLLAMIEEFTLNERADNLLSGFATHGTNIDIFGEVYPTRDDDYKFWIFQLLRYKLNMERLHNLVKDQPMTSMERAIWWIEYVIRNGGTTNLKNSLNKLSWFQYLLLDVALAILISTFGIISVLAIIIVKLKRYSNSLPFEKITRRTKYKLS